MRGGSDFRAGAVLALAILILSLVSVFYLPYGYNDMAPESRFLPPGFSHPMGTDNFGRDVFSRIMTGGRYTLATALITVAGAALIGSGLGLFSGYSGGLIDECVMRIMDAVSSFPGILLALVMISLLENGPFTLTAALLILFIPSFTRIMRSGMLEYKNRDFVLLARIWGTPAPRIIFVHILPNLLPSLLSASVLGLSNAILAEATMSYLGLGIQPPLPSWGRMLSESQNFLFNAPWCALSPGLMIMATVLAFHYLGEGLKRRYYQG
ncbi:MAG: ABC transporter permease [Spirochaetaceae bacterium]|jgi:peptide/nickel transport system permease protein|nr:ABC transporter permease [Spirochaetaceae bacterium]